MQKSIEKRVDIVIVGGGIIGIAIAIEIAKKDKGLSILLIEKEKSIGLHASGRNSGVIHAGFYYKPQSLKAKFCREGNIQLKETCKKLGVPVLNTGKVVVSKDTNQASILEKLFMRGVENGVNLEIFEDHFLSKFEPLAKSKGGFIWSPDTCVSDPKMLISKLAKQALDLGIKFVFGESPQFKNRELYLNGQRILYRHLINSAGSQAIDIANSFNAGKKYAVLPFLGTYAYLNSGSLPLKTLIYPLPHDVNPFLGVHFTITPNNQIKIGPSAIPILGREQYTLLQLPRLKDMFQTMKSSCAMGLKHPHSTFTLAIGEFPKIRVSKLVKEASMLVPSAGVAGVWKRKAGGIRSQLVDLHSGELVQDFLIEKTENETHILNAVSPGWTSAIPFAKWIHMEHVLPSMANGN